MIVDSSALVAILTTESDGEQYVNFLTSDVPTWMSSPSLLETCIVLLREKGPDSVHSAQLNILDTCAYALATRLKQPMVFKGMDFPKTDVMTVL